MTGASSDGHHLGDGLPTVRPEGANIVRADIEMISSHNFGIGEQDVGQRKVSFQKFVVIFDTLCKDLRRASHVQWILISQRNVRWSNSRDCLEKGESGVGCCIVRFRGSAMHRGIWVRHPIYIARRTHGGHKMLAFSNYRALA
jgi:hypothetical protein